ncbi:MAG TPA: NRDE family protein [Motiliproteus sp.]
MEGAIITEPQPKDEAKPARDRHPMCLIVVAYRCHPDYPLVVVANRDEFYRRPTAAAAFWADHPELLAGRDLEQGGTWLGVTRSGRFAAVTNVRNGRVPPVTARSRGHLPVEFLTSTRSAAEHAEQLEPQLQHYGSCNLLTFDGSNLNCLSNRSPSQLNLPPGIYGLSNAALNTPWPKTQRTMDTVQERVSRAQDTATPLVAAELLALLADPQIAADAQLPDTGVNLEWERRLSACFIRSPDYGTRATSVVLIQRSGEVEFVERSFDQRDGPIGEVQERFHAAASLAL